ncbi:MAG: hypothetical protein NT051_00900 [Candidatus Micrarchaeota archaeon]|nr:hypothetical protein [Candidatus Micrarchaeota archaeon]
MAKTKASKDESDAHLLAGLGYIPIMMLNLIIPLYILLAKKGGEYAKYHALQSISLWAIWFVLCMAISIPLMFTMLDAQKTMMADVYAMTQTNTTAVHEGMVRVYDMDSKFYLPVILLICLGFGVIIAWFALAILVATGKDIRLPILSGFLTRFV